jgi:hypothetical protein
MHIDLNTLDSNVESPAQNIAQAYRTCYTTSNPRVVRAIHAWERGIAVFDMASRALGEVFGGEAVSFTWLQSRFIGGIKLAGGVEIDRHWRRADRWGFRTLRLRARIPKGMQLIPPAVIHAEHERLQALWARHCPAALDGSGVWQALGIHLGSVSLWGGALFTHADVAYISLGFNHCTQNAGDSKLDWFEHATLIEPAEFDCIQSRAYEGAGEWQMRNLKA